MKNSLQILGRAKATLELALQERPDLTKRTEPDDYHLYTPNKRGRVDSRLIAFFGAWPGGVVTFKTPDEKLVLGIFKKYKAIDVSFPMKPTGRLLKESRALRIPEYVKNWLASLDSKESWITFLENRKV